MSDLKYSELEGISVITFVLRLENSYARVSSSHGFSHFNDPDLYTMNNGVLRQHLTFTVMRQKFGNMESERTMNIILHHIPSDNMHLDKTARGGIILYG